MKKTKELNLELYKKLYLIRRSEEKIIEHYKEDKMKTPMHMSMGEEAIVAGICHSLNKKDQVFGTYRSHALYLAKTEDVFNFFAEMYGKADSFLKGKGGSMHLCAPDHGFMGTSAIVASGIPVAVGAAFANKIAKNNKIVAVFFGDGATDEGVFWESLNVASYMKLPVLFVCEDNGLAVHTHASKRQGYKAITDIVSQYECYAFKENSTDVEVIYDLSCKAIELMKTSGKPCFLHLKYYRYLEHVGVNYDFDAGYRPKDEFEEWYKKDPVKLQREKLLKMGCSEKEVKSLEGEIDTAVIDVVSKVDKLPFADKNELYKEIF